MSAQESRRSEARGFSVRGVRENRNSTHEALASPQRTQTLQKRFEGEVYRRWRTVKGDIRQAIERRDVLGLSSSSSLEELAEPPEDFSFETDAAKVDAFSEWLQRELDDEVLEPVTRAEVRGGRHWSATYVRPSYQRGVAQGETYARQEGIDVESLENVFNKPIHAEKVKLSYTRTYRELEGVTSEVDKQLSRVVSEAISQGWSPRKAASNINQEIERVGVNRSRTIARTETAYAHNEGSLTRYEGMGTVDRVKVVIEGDACSICSSFSGKRYSIEEARGLVPAHPNCRCSVAPAMEDSS